MPADKKNKKLAARVLTHEGIGAACNLRLLLLLLVLTVSTCACGGAGEAQPQTETPPANPPIGLARGELDAADLLRSDAQPTGLIGNRFYIPMGVSSPALHRLNGRLSVDEGPMQGTAADTDFGQTGLRWFPGFTAEFFVAGGYLVPVERGILERAGTRSHWRVILSPGRVWSETGDGGWSRASFPFVLVSE